MSLTVVVRARSQMVTMRPSISFGGSPAYVHTMVTTGILMYGKDILRGFDRRAEAEQKDQHRKDDERIRAPQRQAEQST